MKKIFFSLLFCNVLFTHAQTKIAPPIIKNVNNAVVYEINVRQYSEEGNLQSVIGGLPKLKSLGVDILWLMPIHPIGVKNRKGTLGSYYSVKDYRAIDPSYGDTAMFRQFVKVAHAMGMKVIMDWVANHTAWDHQWIKSHPNWYVQNKKGAIQTQYDWSDVAKLDYTKPEMRKAMIADMEYWVNNFDIDGFRCDVAFLVPVDFWEQARAQLERKKKLFMLAEMEWNTDINPNPASYFTKAFDVSYAWTFMGVTQDMAKGKKNANDLKKELRENYAKFPSSMSKLFFITNHDENSWNGTIKEKYGYQWKLYATLCYTLPKSYPLIYNGEEVGLNRRIKFFEKDGISKTEWRDTSRYDWYRKIIQLRHYNSALWSNANTSNKIDEVPVADADTSVTNHVYAFKRKNDQHEVIVITNFSSTDVTFTLPTERIDETYQKLFDNRSFTLTTEGRWMLKANENVILYK